MEDEPRLRLESFELFHTDDPDRAREGVSAVFTPHRLSVVGRSELDARMCAGEIDRVRLVYLQYGGPVSIEVEPMDRPFYLVQIPLRGRISVASGRDEVVSSPEMASLPDPRRHCLMRWDADCPILGVYIGDDVLHQHLRSLIGRPPEEPVRFSLGMDLMKGSARDWRAIVDLVLAEVERGNGLIQSPLVSRHLESSLLTGLLIAQPNNYSATLRAEQAPAAPRSVRRAIERLESDAHLPLTVEELAADAGLSVRVLQQGFHQHVGCSPMTYLREVRFERVHAALKEADPAQGDTVTDIAVQWGFTHLGRFSTEYRRKFGESPSQTLRR